MGPIFVHLSWVVVLFRGNHIQSDLYRLIFILKEGYFLCFVLVDDGIVCDNRLDILHY